MELPQESFMHVGNRESVGLSQTFSFGPKQGISSDFSPSCFVLQSCDRCFSGFPRICLVFCCSTCNLGDATGIFNNCLTISNFSPKCLQSQVLACNVIMAIVKGNARNGLGTVCRCWKHPRAAAGRSGGEEQLVPWEESTSPCTGGLVLPIPLLLSSSRLQEQPLNEVLNEVYWWVLLMGFVL